MADKAEKTEKKIDKLIKSAKDNPKKKDKAYEMLNEFINSEDFNVRKAAVYALGRLQDARAVDVLIKCLEDERWEVRTAAVYSLGISGDARAIDELIACLTSVNEKLRLAAVEALDKLGEPKWKECREYSTYSGRMTVELECLIRTKDLRLVEPFINRLANENRDGYGMAKRHIEIIEVLGRLGDKRAVDALIKCLADDRVNRAAIGALEDIADERAIEPLIKCLGDKTLHSAAADALVRLGNEQTVDMLIKYLNDENELAREAAVTSLGKLKDKNAVDALVKCLGDEKHSVRKAAAAALGKIKDEKAADELFNSLADSNGFVRIEAAKALSMIGEKQWMEHITGVNNDFEKLAQTKDKRLAEPFINLLADESGEVRLAAANALGILGELKWGMLIFGEDDDFDDLPFFYNTTKDIRLVRPLIRCLKHSKWLVRKTAAQTLIKIATEHQEIVLDVSAISAIKKEHYDSNNHFDNREDIRRLKEEPHWQSHCETPMHHDSSSHTDTGIGLDVDF